MASPPPSAFDPILADVKELKEAVQPSVVALKTFFSAPESGEIQKCSRIGAGVFVDRKLIITSAYVAGIISTVRDSEIGSTTVHNCFIGRTIAVTDENKVLKTKVLAVDFSGDVAVLEVEGEGEADLPPPCAVARSAVPKGMPLMVITRHGGCNGSGTMQVKVWGMEDDSGRTDWPYNLEDGLGWERYGGQPIDELKIVPGSPWFSLQRQVAGIASKAVGGETVDSVGGFVVPPPRIRSVLDYAKTKSPKDPIVLDPWINTLTFADSDAEGRYQNVLEGFVVTMYASILGCLPAPYGGV